MASSTIPLVTIVFFKNLGLKLTCINRSRVLGRLILVSILMVQIGFILVFLASL